MKTEVKMKISKNNMRILMVLVMAILVVSMLSVTAFAASGDVAGAVEATWNAAKVQIKSVVNNVVFPVIDLVLAVCFFAKVALVYMDYRKHGQIEWTPPAILFATLVFALTAPLYIWDIIGM
jgi:hypothetical protein